MEHIIPQPAKIFTNTLFVVSIIELIWIIFLAIGIYNSNSQVIKIASSGILVGILVLIIRFFQQVFAKKQFKSAQKNVT